MQLFYFKISFCFNTQLIFLSFEATCWASGDPHYKTFDGKHFSFMGDCAYTLAQPKDKSFAITVRNVKCGSSGVTCTKEVYISIQGNNVNLLMGKIPTINGIRIPSSGYSGSGLTIKKSGLFLSILSDMGLTVQWDFGELLLNDIPENVCMLVCLLYIINSVHCEIHFCTHNNFIKASNLKVYNILCAIYFFYLI